MDPRVRADREWSKWARCKENQPSSLVLKAMAVTGTMIYAMRLETWSWGVSSTGKIGGRIAFCLHRLTIMSPRITRFVGRRPVIALPADGSVPMAVSWN